MKISGAIFDMDGTLLNSMDYWGTVGSEFLIKNGFDSKSDDNRRFLERGMREFYKYATEELGLTKSYQEVHDEIYNLIRENMKLLLHLKMALSKCLIPFWKRVLKCALLLQLTVKPSS